MKMKNSLNNKSTEVTLRKRRHHADSTQLTHKVLWCCSRVTFPHQGLTCVKTASPLLLEETTRPCFHYPCLLSPVGPKRMRSCESDCPLVPPDRLLPRPPSPPHTSPQGCTEGPPPPLSEKWREPFSSLPRPLEIRAEEVQCDNS